jgi:hypothetical protein
VAFDHHGAFASSEQGPGDRLSPVEPGHGLGTLELMYSEDIVAKAFHKHVLSMSAKPIEE